MRFAWIIFFAATPAFAHHEAVVVSVLPGLLVWLMPVLAVCVAMWRHRRR